MTDVAFETLIYTDCRPGQGLRGTPGLQFQARSPGADAAAEALVEQALLYEPPARWMRERRPVPDYPPSFAHVCDGLFATAAGVYLGREANGGREGNQLTHAIVTTDPDGYQLQRPAQLFGAPFWTTAPAADTSCPPVRHPWEPGPFDIAAAQRFVVDQPRGADLLEALLTCVLAIGGRSSRRVLFRAEDAEEVLRWISAATLLISHRRAVRVGFKVFTTNPAYAVQPLIAVHPGWDSTSITVEDDGGYAVFDLTTGAFSPVAVDEDARRRVRLLFEEDAYDVLDVVELTEVAPFELARTMVLPKRPLSSDAARAAVTWLRSTPPEVLASSRGVLIDKLLATVSLWPAEVLVELDEVTRSPRVRAALLQCELDRALKSLFVATTKLPARPGTDPAVVLEALALCRDAPSVDAVLRVAHRFGLEVDLERVPGAVGILLDGWQAEPGAYSPFLWGDNGEWLLRELRGELRLRIAAGSADQIGDAWRGRFTLRAPLGDDTLDAALVAAEMAYREGPGRKELAREMLAGLPPAAVGRALAALWHRRPPTAEEYALLGELLPPGAQLPVWMVDNLVGAELTSSLLGLLRRLKGAGVIGDERVTGLLRDDDRLRRICRDVTAAPPAEFAAQIAACAPAVLRLRGDDLVAALRSARRSGQLEPLVAALPPDLQDRVRASGHFRNPLRRR